MPIGEWDTQLLIDGKTQFADAPCPSFVIADEGGQRVILGCTLTSPNSTWVERDHDRVLLHRGRMHPAGRGGAPRYH